MDESSFEGKSPKVEHVVPPQGEDGALNLQRVGLHVAERDYAAAYRTAIYLVSAQPDNPQFHACLADLSIPQGLMDKAAEFRKAADLGLTGMAIHEAHVRDNIPVLNSGYLYVTGGVRQACVVLVERAMTSEAKDQ